MFPHLEPQARGPLERRPNQPSVVTGGGERLVGITSTELPGGRSAAPAASIPGLTAADFAALPPGGLREALDGAAAALFLSAAEFGVDALLQRAGAQPAGPARPGEVLEEGRLYVQDPERPLALEGGRFIAADPGPLPAALNQLLWETAEIANLAPTLEEAVGRVMQRLAAALRWRAVGYRLFGSLTAATERAALPVEAGRVNLAPPAAHSDRRETAALVLPVHYLDQLLAVLVFALPRAELPGHCQELLERVGSQLSAVAARCWAQGDRLHQHVQTARQGRLTGMAELAHSLASELSQPLAAAMNYAGALRRVVERGDRRESDVNRLIEQLMGQVRRAGDILHSVKDFAVHRGCPLEAVNVVVPLRQVLELLEAELRRQDVVLTVEVETELPLVRGNAAYLEQILLCVIGHAAGAVGASPDRRRMSVRAWRSGNEVQIVVTDGSGGIPLQWRDELLESFGPPGVQSDPVGLATSRSLAEAQGGRLWIEEEARGGVNFVLALPVSG